MKKFLLGSAVILSLAMTGIGVSQAAGKHCHHDPYEALNLTQEQRTEIQTILQKNRPEHPDWKAERKAQQEKMSALIDTDSLDQKAVEQWAEEEAKQFKMRLIKRIETQHQIRQILTPEQREKFATFKEKHHGKRADGHHKKHHHHQPKDND